MAGGRKQRAKEKEKRKNAKEGSSSRAAEGSSSSQSHEPQVEDIQGAETILEKCMRVLGIGNAAPENDNARKKLEELALDYPGEAAPCIYLSYHLESLAKGKLVKKAAQQYYIRQAISWAKKAVERTPKSVTECFMEYSQKHALLVAQLAKLSLDDPNYEKLLEKAEEVCRDTMVTAQDFKKKEMEKEDSLARDLGLVTLDGGISLMLNEAEDCRKKLILERELKNSLGIDVDKKDQDVDRKGKKVVCEDKLVEEEDCEEASYDLPFPVKDVKDISELSKVETPPKHRCANIAYIVVDQFKGLDIGFTSFGPEYDSDRATAISLVPFENERDAKRDFDTLKELKYVGIVEAHIVDGMRVMIEFVHSDIETWLNSEYDTFVTTNTNSSGDAWWNHIKDNFKSIFRDVLLTLQFLFSKGAYCRDLANGISVVNGRSAKLYDIKVAEGDLPVRIWQNVDDLSHLMTTVLLKGCENDKSKSSDSILEEGGVPEALRLFLRCLYDNDVRAKWDILWLLDDSFFWNDIQKHSFIRKINSNKGLFRGPGYHKAMVAQLGVTKFDSFFTPGSVEYEVYKHGLQQQEEGEKDGQRGDLPYRDHMFLGVVLYSKNIVFHYNHHTQTKKGYYEVVAIAEDLFHGGCSMIRHVMAKEIFGNNEKTPPKAMDLSEYLSTNPF